MALSEPGTCSHPLLAAVGHSTARDAGKLWTLAAATRGWFVARQQHSTGMSSDTEGNWGLDAWGRREQEQKETEEGGLFSVFFTACLSSCVRVGCLLLGRCKTHGLKVKAPHCLVPNQTLIYCSTSLPPGREKLEISSGLNSPWCIRSRGSPQGSVPGDFRADLTL